MGISETSATSGSGRSGRSGGAVRRWLAAALVLPLLVSGCSEVTAQMDGAEQEPTAGSGPDTAAQTVLTTVEWGEVNGLLSVLVRNDTDRVLRRADAVITVRNDAGVAIGSSAATTIEGRCCTAVEVPPGALFGFYFFLGDAATVDQVEVTYKDVLWADAGRNAASQTSIELVDLHDNAAGSAVFADVTTQGEPIEAAVVQALVDGPDGAFEAVISGTWFCFSPGPPDRIAMQLYTTLPPGSSVRSVTAFPLESAADTTAGTANRDSTCDPEGNAAGGSTTPEDPAAAP